jgi:hypothetical protein
MTRLCRNCATPIGPGKQLCEPCRVTNVKMRRLSERDIELRQACYCPRCRQPWRADRPRNLKFCQACEDAGEVAKSKLTPKQRLARLAEIQKQND